MGEVNQRGKKDWKVSAVYIVVYGKMHILLVNIFYYFSNDPADQ